MKTMIKALKYEKPIMLQWLKVKLKERKLYHYDSVCILFYTSNPISIVIVDNNILSII